MTKKHGSDKGNGSERGGRKDASESNCTLRADISPQGAAGDRFDSWEIGGRGAFNIALYSARGLSKYVTVSGMT